MSRLGLRLHSLLLPAPTLASPSPARVVYQMMPRACRCCSQKTVIRWPKSFPGHTKSKSQIKTLKSKGWNGSKAVDRLPSVKRDRAAPSNSADVAGLSLSEEGVDVAAYGANLEKEEELIDAYSQGGPESANVTDHHLHFQDSDVGLVDTFILERKFGDRVSEGSNAAPSSEKEHAAVEGKESPAPGIHFSDTARDNELQGDSVRLTGHREEENNRDNDCLTREKGATSVMRNGKLKIPAGEDEDDQDALDKTDDCLTREKGATSVMRNGKLKIPAGEDEDDQDALDKTDDSSEETGDGRGWGITGDGMTQQDATEKVHKSTQSKRFRKLNISSKHEVLYGISPCLLALQQNRRQIAKALVLEAFKNSARPEAQEILKLLAERDVQMYETNRRELNKLSHGRPHQGVCLEVSGLQFESLAKISGELMTTSAESKVCILALDQVMDPMNLGALMRSAYFLGVDKVVASRYKCCPLTPTVSKASSGISEVMPVYSASNMESFLKELGSLGWLVMGATNEEEGDHADRGMPVSPCGTSLQLCRPTVLVIGSEGFGLRKALRSQCHRLVTIPAGRTLHPSIDSLNVSVAAGIILHSLLVNR